jgi:hypothetical protein
MISDCKTTQADFQGLIRGPTVWLLKHGLHHLERLESELGELEVESRCRITPMRTRFGGWRPSPVNQITAETILAELEPHETSRISARTRNTAVLWQGGSRSAAMCVLRLPRLETRCEGTNESGREHCGRH